MGTKDNNASCNICNCYIGSERYNGSKLCPTCGKEDRMARAQQYNRKRGMKPMGENRECTLYLGVHVAERVLSKVFKNVERMPNNNPGYDFICGKGYKIDVKSSCVSTYGRLLGQWKFAINRNTTADYFLCIAFDTREDLVPLHCWLIPGRDVNDKTGVGISVTTLSKWDKYATDHIDDIDKCCNMLR